MNKIKVMTIFGTRPEAIKMAPVIKELKLREEIECIVCVTAQHREMLDQVLNVFEITPDYDLNIMSPGQTLAQITSRVISGIDEIIKKVMPDIILVHGDTNTTFASSIAAYYNKVAIGHVEAGLRTFDKYAPYPEEMNRQMVSRVADLNFAPTTLSQDNLINDGIKLETIYVTGNTAIDAMKTTIHKGYHSDILKNYKNKRIILLTCHRRENIGVPMENIFEAVKEISEEYSDVVVIYPIHKNPVIREIASRYFKKDGKVKLIEPLDVIDFHNFINRSYLILTDSGGIQEEAPSLGKPVLVLRETTERPEGIEAGTLKLVGTDKEVIINETKKLLDNKKYYKIMSDAHNPYGDGSASIRIVNAIIEKYKK